MTEAQDQPICAGDVPASNSIVFEQRALVTSKKARAQLEVGAGASTQAALTGAGHGSGAQRLGKRDRWFIDLVFGPRRGCVRTIVAGP
ncbi:hypothetical protein G6O69_06610 [Pseudenhygromyxa sp. WMMC2535]|uniref:hypothetical protein n=1 Tax=Pseudenhygromyxa sp. WMMC2535 TaxID=2712867 RepID=UPI00159599ED|nr:hypothetical protein [Pseudenhygromyxa sp. WMMC2535]NVB37497.1 hypothetical protein [Pseudenhygromyxa sp. WMMC2535]